MGKGNRGRTARQEQKTIVRAELGKTVSKKAMNKEINAQLALAHGRFVQDETAVILWALHEAFGFGAKRLRQFYDCYDGQWRALKAHYEASDEDMPYVASQKLKELGVDLEAWDREAAQDG